MFIWFTAALYFFALSFSMNDVLGNPYLNLAVTGLCVCVSVFLIWMIFFRLIALGKFSYNNPAIFVIMNPPPLMQLHFVNL